MFKRNSKKEEVTEHPKIELKEVSNGQSLDDLVKVCSSRNCDVYRINPDIYLTAIKKDVLNDRLEANIIKIKEDINREVLSHPTLPINDIITQNGKLLGYTTDSYSMTLKEYFLQENPSLTTTQIILRKVRELITFDACHGDLSLENIVIKDGNIYLTNRLVKSHNNNDDFYLLNDIERELLANHGHPCNCAMPIHEADCAVYDYLYYLLLNTTGEERNRLIEAGLESCYKDLFDKVPNKHIDEKRLELIKRQINHVDHYEDGSVVSHLMISMF